MEKRQLVRTFGTALATATLSFGLFAAPALADASAKGAGSVETTVTYAEDWKAVPGTTISFKVPVTLTDIEEDDILDATVTFGAKDTGVSQELDAKITGWVDENGNKADNNLSKYKKVYGTFNVTVPAQALNGTWSARELSLWVLGEPNAIVVDLSGTTFQVKDGMKAADLTAPKFEAGTLNVLRSTLTSKDDNEISVRFQNQAGNGGTVTAKYTNPAGNTNYWGIELDTIEQVDKSTQALIYKASTSNLPNKTQGVYTLAELKVRSGITFKSSEADEKMYDYVKGGYVSEVYVTADRASTTPDTGEKINIYQFKSEDGDVIWVGDNGKYYTTEDQKNFTETSYSNAEWLAEDLNKTTLIGSLEHIRVTTPSSYDTVSDLYMVDYYSPLAAGAYNVAAGLVVPMYRAYNPYDGQHLYTDSIEEMANVIAAGWNDEGVAWFAPANVWDTAVKKPIYRLYNEYNGDHHYTDSKDEAAAMIENGWKDEGIGFFSLIEKATMDNPFFAEATPVYRVFNKYAKVGTHHYTTSKGEYDALVDAGWNGENVGWYGVDWEKSTR